MTLLWKAITELPFSKAVLKGRPLMNFIHEAKNFLVGEKKPILVKQANSWNISLNEIEIKSPP